MNDKFQGELSAYILNMENIINYIFDNSNEKEGDSEITELYVMDEGTKNMTLSTKQLREIKSKEITTHQSIRYDMVKMLLDRLMDISDDELTLGETVVINTLLTEGLISEIKESDL
jgi:hypothetical protein